jgi:hypothetical protein
MKSIYIDIFGDVAVFWPYKTAFSFKLMPAPAICLHIFICQAIFVNNFIPRKKWYFTTFH